MGTYEQDSTWQEIQRFLPSENRLAGDNMPIEYSIPVCGAQIHIDHYRSDTPRGRVLLFHGVGGNGRLLSFIALPLVANGFEVVCPDFPLYGCTEYEETVEIGRAHV